MSSSSSRIGLCVHGHATLFARASGRGRSVLPPPERGRGTDLLFTHDTISPCYVVVARARVAGRSSKEEMEILVLGSLELKQRR